MTPRHKASTHPPQTQRFTTGGATNASGETVPDVSCREAFECNLRYSTTRVAGGGDVGLKPSGQMIGGQASPPN